MGSSPTLPQLTLPLQSALSQQLNAIIAASMSIKSSDKLRQILEVRAQGRGLGSGAHPWPVLGRVRGRPGPCSVCTSGM